MNMISTTKCVYHIVCQVVYESPIYNLYGDIWIAIYDYNDY